MARKVLLSGDPEGKLGALFKRVAAVNKSNGPFDMLLCVGSFFTPGGAPCVRDMRARSNITYRVPPPPLLTPASLVIVYPCWHPCASTPNDETRKGVMT